MTNNPYILPADNVLISFSGGRTSGYMLHEILQANGDLPERAKVVFCNTGKEAVETLDFVRDCEQAWSVNVSWLEYGRVDNKVTFKLTDHANASRAGEPFDTLIESRHGYLPNQATRYCTQELKVKTIKRYLVSLGWRRWSNCVGIRADEQRRIKPSKDNRWQNWYPLADALVSKQIIKEFWKQADFDLTVPPGLGNCDGCFLKSEATLAAVWRERPTAMQWWADWEKQNGVTFNKRRSYAELGQFVQRQGDWIFDDEAYLCQADDGECTE